MRYSLARAEPVGHPGRVPFLPVYPDDADAVAISVDILNTAMDVDDPTSPRQLPALEANFLRYGWDLEPPDRYLYVPPGEREAVGLLDLEIPQRDNTHLVWASLTVRPEARRRGHGTALLNETIRRTRAAGRTTVWVGAAADDAGAREFVSLFGFRQASTDARRRQELADVDREALARLFAQAREAATDYDVARLGAPVGDDVLAELVEVTAAINDAPMGDLTYEDEVFDVARLRDMQTARAGTGDRMYRVVARSRATGRIAAHTVVITHPQRPWFAFQGDTAVSREYRGHKLGLLVKLEMLDWLATAEPQLETIETFNNAGNSFMIDVNEAIGYRLSRLYDVHELAVAAAPSDAGEASERESATARR